MGGAANRGSTVYKHLGTANAVSMATLLPAVTSRRLIDFDESCNWVLYPASVKAGGGENNSTIATQFLRVHDIVFTSSIYTKL